MAWGSVKSSVRSQAEITINLDTIEKVRNWNIEIKYLKFCSNLALLRCLALLRDDSGLLTLIYLESEQITDATWFVEMDQIYIVSVSEDQSGDYIVTVFVLFSKGLHWDLTSSYQVSYI